MYKVYQTSYKPFWVNGENKPSYNYFNSINFDWQELINSGANYVNEKTVSLSVKNLDKLYFKIEEIENNVVKKVFYYHFENVLKRMDTSMIISCKIDLWATYNIHIENKWITTNPLVKFKRATLQLWDFKQYYVYNDSLLESIPDWRAKNNPRVKTYDRINLVNKKYGDSINLGGEIPAFENYEYYLDDKLVSKSWMKNTEIVSNLDSYAGVYDDNSLNQKIFKQPTQRNYIYNKYLVVYDNNMHEYLLFPDFSVIEEDANVTAGKEINELYKMIDTSSSKTKFPNLSMDYSYSPIKVEGEIAKNPDDANNKNWVDITWWKVNNKAGMWYLLNNSSWFAAKSDIGYYYGPDLYTLLTKFKPEWKIMIDEKSKKVNNLTFYDGHVFFAIRLPFNGLSAKNVFDVPSPTPDLIINENQTSMSYLSGNERFVIIGNTSMRYKQLLNNDYVLRFDASGFKLIPTNQTNNELFQIITYGDILPTQKDKYLEYVNSVRNSVNTGYWTNYSQKWLETGVRGFSGAANSLVKGNVVGFSTGLINLAANSFSLEYQNSLTIANTKAKYADLKNSLSVVPQTSNIEDIIYYQIPQNWIRYNKGAAGDLISYQYSIFDWLDTTTVDINNLYVYYGFELNNTYNYAKVSSNEDYYYIQPDLEFLSRNINNLYDTSIDMNVKVDCINQFGNGVRIFKNEKHLIKWNIQ